MGSAKDSNAFVEQVVTSQRRLYAYILTLLPNSDVAQDILQQTNMAMWREVGSFAPGTNFTAWSYRIAYFRVLEYREKLGRERLHFDSQLVETLAQESESYTADENAQLEAMRKCVEQLAPTQQDLIHRRYIRGELVSAIADSLKENANTIANRLYRIRSRLWNCIQHRMLGEANA